MADITVNAGGNLQTALNSAAGGDRIICEKGATFTGQFTLPTKSSTVTITSSSVLDGLLPSRRLALGDAAQLATITGPHNTNWTMDGSGASNWTLDGLRFIPTTGLNNGVVDFAGETNANLTFSRLLFDGSGGVQKRFLRCDGQNVLVKWMYVHDLHKPGEDGQGISIVRGAGPYTILDTYINGGSECIMVGGGGTSSAANNPQNVLVEHCELSQPLGRYPDTHAPKNLFELKNVNGCILRYCILRDIPESIQAATAIMLTPANQEGDSPWVRVYDVLIEHNRIRNAGRILTIAGYGYTGTGYTEATKALYSTGQTDLITFRHNLCETVAMEGEAERLLQAAGEVGTLRMEHNTYVNSDDVADVVCIQLPNDAQCLRTGGASDMQDYSIDTFIFKDNMMQGRILSPVGHGVTGNDRDDIVRTFTTSNNVVGLVDPGTWAAFYPGFTRESISTYNANFADTTDYLLTGGSPHNNAASDATDIGWDGEDGQPSGGGGGSEAIVWTSFTGDASAVGNDLSAGPSSGALSVQEITGDGSIEWVVATTTNEMYVGLGTNAAYDLMQTHAFEFSGSSWGIRESGVYKTDATFAAGDTFRIDIISGDVTYFKNDTLVYTSLTAATLPTKCDVGFYGSGGTVSDAMITTEGGASNVAPTVNAGPDRNIGTGGTATLSGSVSDDGLPDPPGAVTSLWTKTSGPGTVTFADASLAATTATFSANGTYVLRLTADDSDLTAFDEMTVVQAAANTAPTVSAGPDRAISTGGTATLSGSASDDGLPNPPGALTITWSKISGPGTVSFANPNVASTTATVSANGVYVCRLTAYDGALTTTDDMTITQTAPVVPTGFAPIIYIGGVDKTGVVKS